jgi:hypothetical protein
MRWSVVPVTIVVSLLVLLPIFYLLGLGPAIWLHRNGSPGGQAAIETIYAPLEWIMEHSPAWANQPIEWYAELWEPSATFVPAVPVPVSTTAVAPVPVAQPGAAAGS